MERKEECQHLETAGEIPMRWCLDCKKTLPIKHFFTSEELDHIIIDMKHILKNISLDGKHIELRKSVIEKAESLTKLNERK